MEQVEEERGKRYIASLPRGANLHDGDNEHGWGKMLLEKHASVRLTEEDEHDEIHHADQGGEVLGLVADSRCSEHTVAPQDIEGIKVHPSKAGRAGR